MTKLSKTKIPLLMSLPRQYAYILNINTPSLQRVAELSRGFPMWLHKVASHISRHRLMSKTPHSPNGLHVPKPVQHFPFASFYINNKSLTIQLNLHHSLVVSYNFPSFVFQSQFRTPSGSFSRPKKLNGTHF